MVGSRLSGLRIRISGENYDKSFANSLIIEIYAGKSQTPYETLTVKEFMRCGAYSWPDHDLIKERPIRIVIYDPKGFAANWVVLLEVEVSN